MKRVCSKKYTFLSERRIKHLLSRNGSTAVLERRVDIKSIDDLPGPTSLPFIGSSWRYYPKIGATTYQNEHLHIFDNYKKYGPIWKEERGFGEPPNVVLCSAEDMEQLLKEEGPFPIRDNMGPFNKYRRESKYFNRGSGINNLQGKDWRTFRSKVQPPLMKTQSSLAYMDVMNQISDEFINNRLSPQLDENNQTPNDFGNELQKWAIETLCSVIFNKRLGSMDTNPRPNSDAETIIPAITRSWTLLHKMTSGPPLWQFFKTPIWIEYKERMDKYSSVLERYVEDAVTAQISESPVNENNPSSILDKYLMKKDLDVDGASVFTTEMLMAGGDTVSHAASFIIYELAKNPMKQQILFEEVRRLLPSTNEPVTAGMTNELKYMKACIKEALRLHPITVGLFRTTVKDSIYSGYHIPKGTSIIAAQYVTSRLEKYFPDPLKFRPERWLGDGDSGVTNKYAILPFGHGPRGCVGKRIAKQKLWILLTKLVRRYQINYHYGELNSISRFNLPPDKPLKFQFIERK